jgi:hypothetical protein
MVTPFQFTTHVDAVEPCTPPRNFYRFTEGTWVNFSVPGKPEEPKRRGCIRSVEDTHALVMDERTFGDVWQHILHV